MQDGGCLAPVEQLLLLPPVPCRPGADPANLHGHGVVLPTSTPPAPLSGTRQRASPLLARPLLPHCAPPPRTVTHDWRGSAFSWACRSAGLPARPFAPLSSYPSTALRRRRPHTSCSHRPTACTMPCSRMPSCTLALLLARRRRRPLVLPGVHGLWGLTS